jgi:hypothetical protein
VFIGIGGSQEELPIPPKKVPISKLLQIDKVQEEIELNPDQLESIKKIERDMLDKVDQLRQESLSNKDSSERNMKNIAESVQALIAEAESSITEDVLVGFQSERLNQIQWRIELDRIGVKRFLDEKSISSFLGMTEMEKKKFLAKAMAERRRTMEKIEKLKMEMEKNMFSLLPKSCQENLDVLLGDEFYMKRSSWRPHIKP